MKAPICLLLIIVTANAGLQPHLKPPVSPQIPQAKFIKIVQESPQRVHATIPTRSFNVHKVIHGSAGDSVRLPAPHVGPPSKIIRIISQPAPVAVPPPTSRLVRVVHQTAPAPIVTSANAKQFKVVHEYVPKRYAPTQEQGSQIIRIVKQQPIDPGPAPPVSNGKTFQIMGQIGGLTASLHIAGHNYASSFGHGSPATHPVAKIVNVIRCHFHHYQGDSCGDDSLL